MTAQSFFFLTHFFNDLIILPVLWNEAVWTLHNGHRLLPWSLPWSSNDPPLARVSFCQHSLWNPFPQHNQRLISILSVNARGSLFRYSCSRQNSQQFGSICVGCCILVTGGVGNVIEAIKGGTRERAGSLKILEGGSRGVFLAKTQQNVNILMYIYRYL